VNIQDVNVEPTTSVMLTGYATNLYVSQSNIYVTMPDGLWWSGEGETIVHRISIDNGAIDIEASGTVPGRILNQFSMDEYDNHFRIATTSSSFGGVRAANSNNVYILDSELSIVGRLENLAPGEQIYSARFMGDKGYLVTFKNIDPLFTLDLSDPSSPMVLGKLKIPGYSNYLHPFDENHLIGIGKEAVESKDENFAWYQGVKISLFNIEDVETPKEVGKLLIGDRGTDSPVLYDHHAMLFDKRSGVIVIPILEAKIFPEKYPQGVPPSTHGEYVFQGAYVLNIDVEDGIEVKGMVTHIDDPQVLIKSGYYLYSPYEIVRSLYIGEVLYTISSGKVVASSLENLEEISALILS
jgi:uncharacterized secreted protein with C-terminal beta-propeller domain